LLSGPDVVQAVINRGLRDLAGVFNAQLLQDLQRPRLRSSGFIEERWALLDALSS